MLVELASFDRCNLGRGGSRGLGQVKSDSKGDDNRLKKEKALLKYADEGQLKAGVHLNVAFSPLIQKPFTYYTILCLGIFC